MTKVDHLVAEHFVEELKVVQKKKQPEAHVSLVETKKKESAANLVKSIVAKHLKEKERQPVMASASAQPSPVSETKAVSKVQEPAKASFKPTVIHLPIVKAENKPTQAQTPTPLASLAAANPSSSSAPAATNNVTKPSAAPKVATNATIPAQASLATSSTVPVKKAEEAKAPVAAVVISKPEPKKEEE